MFSNTELEQRYQLTERDRKNACYLALFIILVVCVIIFVI